MDKRIYLSVCVYVWVGYKLFFSVTIKRINFMWYPHKKHSETNFYCWIDKLLIFLVKQNKILNNEYLKIHTYGSGCEQKRILHLLTKITAVWISFFCVYTHGGQITDISRLDFSKYFEIAVHFRDWIKNWKKTRVNVLNKSLQTEHPFNIVKCMSVGWNERVEKLERISFM